jgi:dTDP-4-amino-4,6-dideoxygalactose transaminase
MAADSGTPPAPPVGGFFELHEPSKAGEGPSVLQAWTARRPYAAFVNARSAFAALTAVMREATLWLPAFLCADMLMGARSARVRYYPVEEGFEPDLTTVETLAEAGDIVLLTAMFGLPVSAATRAFVRRRGDLRIVEDRAQALGPGMESCGGYELYSPRKLMGVADGGILVAPDANAPLPQPTSHADEHALWRAPLLRHADHSGGDNANWHAANQAKEAAMTVTTQAITRRSLSILSETSISRLASRRFANWRFLDSRLNRWSALPVDPPAPPLGYVLRLAPGRRDRLLAALHESRIFAAVHWLEIAAPAADFPREAGWTREILTLPSDHRYGEAEMGRIADCVTQVLQ